MRKSAIFVGAWLALLAGVLALVLHGRGRTEREPLAAHPSESSGVPESSMADAPFVPPRSPVPTILPSAEPARPPKRTEIARPTERPRAAPTAELVFRLLRPDRQPLANQEIEVRIVETTPGRLSISNGSSATDGEGRASFTPLASLSKWTAPALVIYAHLPSGGLRGEFVLSPQLPRGRNDLGDIVLSSARLLVAGRAVDAEGHPLRSGSVEIRLLSSEGRWLPSGLSRELEHDGTFTFFDDPPGGPLRLIVEADGHAPSDLVPFAPGASGLLVQVADGGALVGSIRLPEGTRASDFSVFLRACDGWESGKSYRLDPRADGSFKNSDLSAGPYDVEVALRNGGRLVVIPRVLVEDGQTTRDPRAQQIDLSADLHCVRVRVSLPDGAPATRGTVCVLQPKVRSYSRMERELRDGVAELPLHEDAPDLAVIVEGFCVVRLARVDADRDVVLREPAIDVDLVLPRMVELPSSGRLMLTLSVAREDRDRLGMWWQPLALVFDESRKLHASFQLPGTYTLEFRLGPAPRDEPGIAGTSRITIDASSAGRTIAVEPDPVAYARALGR